MNRIKNISASRAVKIGDVLTVASEAGVRIIRIAGVVDRRGSAVDAQGLYEELTPQAPSLSADAPSPPTRTPRPSARDRRMLAELKRTGTTQ